MTQRVYALESEKVVGEFRAMRCDAEMDQAREQRVDLIPGSQSWQAAESAVDVAYFREQLLCRG